MRLATQGVHSRSTSYVTSCSVSSGVDVDGQVLANLSWMPEAQGSKKASERVWALKHAEKSCSKRRWQSGCVDGDALKRLRFELQAEAKTNRRTM